MKSKIQKYTQLNGISGNETLIKQQLENIFSNSNSKITKDNLGSIATTIKSLKDNGPKIGIFAHMDEVGLLINEITKEGIIKVVNVGGLNVEPLICQRVKYINSKEEEFIGIVMATSPHVKNDTAKKIEDLNVEFGFQSKEEAEKLGFKVGNYVNFIGEFTELQNNNYITKAADDRIGIAIIEKLYEEYNKKENNFELTLGATVQEEIGLKGASTLLHALDIDFDWILIVDVSPIDGYKDLKLSKGPLLRLAEPRGVYDVKGNEELAQIAKNLKVDIQNYFSKGRTDGAVMQITKSGYKTNALCVPALNLHTNNTMFNLDDVESIITIIKGYLDEL